MGEFHKFSMGLVYSLDRCSVLNLQLLFKMKVPGSYVGKVTVRINKWSFLFAKSLVIEFLLSPTSEKPSRAQVSVLTIRDLFFFDIRIEIHESMQKAPEFCQGLSATLGDRGVTPPKTPLGSACPKGPAFSCQPVLGFLQFVENCS